MDLVQLRCFVSLADELHFGRAAERVNLTQPPFSRHIALLEAELGVTLFTRTTRQVVLSSPGIKLLPRAVQVLSLCSEIRELSKPLATGVTGTVRLGFTSGASYAILPRIVEWVQMTHPDVELHLEEMGTYQQIDALKALRLDVGFIRPPNSSQGLIVSPFVREPLKIAVPSLHSDVVQGKHISKGDLLDQRLLLYDADTNSYMHGVVQQLLANAGIVPRATNFVRAIHTMLPLVAVGYGWAFVPESANRLGFENVSFLELEKDLVGYADIFLAYSQDNTNPAAIRLLGGLRSLIERSISDGSKHAVSKSAFAIEQS